MLKTVKTIKSFPFLAGCVEAIEIPKFFNLMDKVCDEVDFLHAYKHQSSLQVGITIFGEHGS